MSESRSLTDREIREQEFLRHQGYYRAREVFTADEVAAAKEAVFQSWGIDEETARTLGGAAVEGSRKQYQAVQNIAEVMDMVTNPQLLDVVERFLGPNIAMPLNRHNHTSINPPGALFEGLHRDHGEPTRGLLSAVIYLDDADEANGCTRVIPGSHLWGSTGHAINDGYWLEDSPFAYLADQAVPVPTAAGDVLLFDGHVYHGLGQNTSTATRASITVGYHSVDQLASTHDPERLLIVRGEDVYRGNDPVN